MIITVCDNCKKEILQPLLEIKNDVGLYYELQFKQKPIPSMESPYGKVQYVLCKPCLINKLNEVK